MKFFTFLSMSCLVFLSGCFIEESIVDDISMITVIGFDKEEEDKVLATISVPYYLSEIEVINRVYETEGFFTKDAVDLGSSKSENPMVIAQTEVIIFSKELAEEGLFKYLDSYQRDPSISTRLFVAIAKEESASLLRNQLPTNKDLGVTLGRLFRHNIEQNFLPKTNLHLYLFDYYQEGVDPVLPILTKEQDAFVIDGIGFLKGDQLKGTINFNYDTMVFRQLKESFDHGSFTFKVNDGELASVQNISSKKHVEVKEGSTPTIKIRVDMDGYMREYSGSGGTKKVINEIDKEMEKLLEARAKHILQQFEEWGVDPIGLGNEIRKTRKNWKEKEWENIYEKVNVEVEYNVTVKETGVIS
ncbi:Ger(x)C family spore germination protein [Halobacillus massiliensis]|uniref:Ger(x)C family spore germination protein n=1 Tax=Halobacillus massiliensis TaxID=1926286 RepID=UPI0009E1FEEE|nr:Ger(x)C family spore germination protein [Halobacillus massiliensis]